MTHLKIQTLSLASIPNEYKTLVLAIVLHNLFKQGERKFSKLLETFMWKIFRPLRTQ